MTTYAWEKNDGSGWVPFSGTPTVANPTESFAAGTWDVRVTVTEGVQSVTETRLDYVIASEASGGDYEGPLDLVPGAVVGVSSLRAPGSAMLEEAAYTLRKLDGGVQPTQEFDYAAAPTGLVDSAAITTFLGEDGNQLVTWQGGGGVNLTTDDEPSWNANAGKPIFAFTDGQWVANFSIPSLAGGARTYVFVIDYQIDADQFGGVLVEQAVEGVRVLKVSEFYNAQDDLFIECWSADELSTATWSTTATLAAGLHLVELQFDAQGNLTVLIDGDDAQAVLEEGSAFAMSAAASSFMQFGNLAQNENPYTYKYGEFYIWPQEDMGAAARSNIMTAWGIS